MRKETDKNGYDYTLSLLERVAGWFSLVYGLGVTAVLVVPTLTWDSVFAEILHDNASAVLYCVAFVSSGVLVLVGYYLNKPKLLANGLFVLTIVRIFQVVSLVALFGLLQPNWLTTAAALAASVILWLGRKSWLNKQDTS